MLRTALSKKVAVSDHWPCSEPVWGWRLSVPATSPSARGRWLRLTSRRDGRRHGDRCRTLSATALQPGIAPSRTRSAGENSSRAADRAGLALHRPRPDDGRNPGRRAARRRAAPAYRDALARDRCRAFGPCSTMAAGIHHRDAPGDAAHDREIMRDEQIAQPEPLLQVEQQIDDLGLHRDVERRDRFVADDEFRPQRERPRDADALPLAAGEFMRVAVAAGAGQADDLQQFDDTIRALLARMRRRRCRAARQCNRRPACAD